MDNPYKIALLGKVQPSREKWDRTFRPDGVETPGEGEESVWDYPRPPIVVPNKREMRVECDGHVVARSGAVLEVKETAGAPVPYFPPESVELDWLEPNGAVTVCEWKGAGVSHDLLLPDGTRIGDAAWMYPDPFDDLGRGYGAIAGWFAFYPAKLACFVGEERVRPQPGGIYGGWITERIKGPVKGEPGTEDW